MKKPTKRGSGVNSPPATCKGRGSQDSNAGRSSRPDGLNLQEHDRLIEQARQVVAETPDIRPEKVEPVQEAVASGAYEIDARKVANALITKIILDS
jgi:negative regulator of flagellin synthesis FlgM